MAKLKTFFGTQTRVIQGLARGNRQVDVMVAATSQKAAHAALVAAGIHGWTLYAFRQFWTEGENEPLAIDNPSVPFYRPDGIHGVPWVRWDWPYPVEQIDSRYREAKGADR